MDDEKKRKQGFSVGYLAGLSGMPLAIAPALDVSGMWSYDGVVLPGWHRVDSVDKFYHQAIMKHESDDMYIFYDTLMGGFSISPSGLVFTAGVEAVLTCRSGDSEWRLEKESDYVREDGYIGRVENFIWTDVDVLNTAGTQIVKYGTQPVPAAAYNIDNKALALGCRIGRIIRSQIAKPAEPDAPSGEPIAYLFNGVELPPIPYYDTVAYPYARIRRDGTFYYVEILSSKPITKEVTNPITQKTYETNGLQTSGKWGCCALTIGYDENWSGMDFVDNNNSNKRIDSFIWANYDVFHADGTPYLAKSDPVPVYE